MRYDILKKTKKAISFLTLITFITTNISYASIDPNKMPKDNTLRVNLTFSSSEFQDFLEGAAENARKRDGMDIYQADSQERMQQVIVIAAIREWRRQGKTTAFIEENLLLAFPGLDLYRIVRVDNRGTFYARLRDRYVKITKKGIEESSQNAFLSLRQIGQDKTKGSPLDLLRYLVKNGYHEGNSISRRDLIEARGFSSEAVRLEINSLIAIGLLERIARGQYSLSRRLTLEQVDEMQEDVKSKGILGKDRQGKTLGLDRWTLTDLEKDKIAKIKDAIAETMEDVPVSLTLRTFLAAIAGFNEALVSVPMKLTDIGAEAVQDFFTAVTQITRLAKDFEKQEPSYASAYIYESLCFVDVDSERRLGLIVTPFSERRTVKTLDVLVFDAFSGENYATPQPGANYTRRQVPISSVEMLSGISERLEERDIFALSMRFRAEYLDNDDGPGTRQTRKTAKDFFLYFTSRDAGSEILKGDAIIGRLDLVDKDMAERIRILQKNQAGKDTLDDWFIELIQGRPQLLQFLLYTADATSFWYDLLLNLDYQRAINELFLSNPDAGAAYVSNAYEQAVVASWIYAHRADFKSILAEREVVARIEDFQLSLRPETLGITGEPISGKTMAEYPACLNCAFTPCQHGKLGSVAAKDKIRADFIAGIMSLIKDDNVSALDQLRALESGDAIIQNVYANGRALNIEESDVTKWLGMTYAKLNIENRALIDSAEEFERQGLAKNEPHCPLEVPVATMFRLMREGKLEEALKVLHEKSFLAGIFGLICPQEYLCQTACTMGKVDERPLAIDIGKLEHLIEVTYLKLYGGLPTPEVKPPTGKYVAIIGSGPAALQAAYDLAKEGHKVVIFEHLHKLGGVLVYGIPTFRLPPEILDEKIRVLEEMGVQFVTNTIIGENGAYTIEELRRSFDSVIIGVGAGQSNKMELKGKVVIVDESTNRAKLEVPEHAKRVSVPGRLLNGVYSAYHFLSWTFLMNAMKPEYETPIPLSKKVLDAFRESRETGKEVETTIVVEGVGNVALDCGRTALRWINMLNRIYGTNVRPKIIFLYRRPKTDLPLKARAEELRHALEEGFGGRIDVEVYELHQTVEYVGEGDNVSAIKAIKYDRPGSTEGVLVDVKTDMVIEALGAKPATEILGTSIPLDDYGYIRIADYTTMQVQGLDGTDGLASVYAMGDCAEAGDENPRIVGTAVLAAAHGKRAAEGSMDYLATGELQEPRLVDVERVFFGSDKYKQYQILHRKEIGRRSLLVGEEVVGEQRTVEFTVYAPHVARRIKPGQFVTLMADQYGEKIPITYVYHGSEEGTIRFAIQDAGKSTKKINDMQEGDSFYAVTGPAGTPSVFTGLPGETSLVGMGSGIAAIVGIAKARADLNNRLTRLIDDVGRERDHSEIVPLLQSVWSDLRLPKPDIVHDIITSIREGDYEQTARLLKDFSGPIRENFPQSEIAQDLDRLAVTVETLSTSILDEEELELAIKQEVYPAIDDAWETLEALERTRLLNDIEGLIRQQKHQDALRIIKEVVGEGFQTKVFLAVGDKDLLIFREELEEVIGKENIFIALEDKTGFNAREEGYAGRFFEGYGTVAFKDYLEKTQTPMNGLLVAGPAFAMVFFEGLVREVNRPDILSTRNVWMSTNAPMFCAYGGCLYCLIDTEEAVPWRGCLGPEKEADMIIGPSVVKRLATAAPQEIEHPVVQTLDAGRTVAHITQALEEMTYIPTKDGRLLAAVSDSQGKVVVELKKGSQGKELQESDIFAALTDIDWDRLGITQLSQRLRYARRVSSLSGLELTSVMDRLKLSIQGGSGPSKANPTIEDLFTKGADLPIVGVRKLGEFTEVEIAQSGFLQLKPVLEMIGRRDSLEEMLGLEGNVFMFILDRDGKSIAVIVRNEERQKELFWIEGAASPKLFTYLMLRASQPGLNQFVNLTVEEIREPGALLRPGAIMPAGTATLRNVGTWTTRMAEFDQDVCVTCGACTLVCPDGAIAFDLNDAVTSGRLVLGVNPEACKGCASCAVACPFEGHALKMIEKTDLQQTLVSLDTNLEGRAVVIEGQAAMQFKDMFAEQSQDDFRALKELLGVEYIDVVSINDTFIQLKYQISNVSYLVSFDIVNTRLTVRPFRTFAVVGFDEDNRALVKALQEKGFAGVVILSVREDGFEDKLRKADESGVQVYTIEKSLMENVAGSLQDLLDLTRFMQLTRVVTVNSQAIQDAIGLTAYTDFVGEISRYTGHAILRPADSLITGNLDFDQVMQSFAPRWDAQERYLASGHGLCPGCGQGTDTHLMLDTARKLGFAPAVVLTTGCLEVSTTIFPHNAWKVPTIHGNYTASAGIVAGIFRTYEWLKRMGISIFGDKELLPVAIMGDGGFAIGLNVISGELAANLPILYIVENNSGTQNTGYQLSTLAMQGTTASGLAGIKTTPGVSVSDIAKAHGPNVYYARVSNAHPEDYQKKLAYAMEWIRQGRGPAVIESFNTPCPTGWKSEPTEVHEQVSLLVETAVGANVLFEQVGEHIRITQPPLERDGQIYINTEHLESLRYELSHLTDTTGATLLSDTQVGNIISYVSKRKQGIVERALRQQARKTPRTGLPRVEPDIDALKERILLRALNLPVEGLQLINRLNALELYDELEAIADFRSEENEFTGKQDVLEFMDEERYDEVAQRALDLAYATGEIRDAIGELTGTDIETEDITLEQVFETTDGILEVEGIGRATFIKIQPYLTLEPRRPHIIEYYARQGRWRRLLKENKELVEALQQDVDERIAFLKKRHEESAAFFAQLDRDLDARGVPASRSFTYASAREAHEDVLVPKLNIPDDADRLRRIAERKVRIGNREFADRAHGRGGQGTVTVAEILAIYANATEAMQVQAAPSFGATRTGAPVLATVRMGTERIRLHTPVREPDVVVVIDESLLSLPDVLSGIKPDGFLLVNSERTPIDIRRQLEATGVNIKNIKIFTLDASGISKKHMGRNLPNIPMLAARILVSQLTEVDLGSPESAMEYVRQILAGRYNESVARANYNAMQEAFRSLKVETGTFEEMRAEFLATREPIEGLVVQEEALAANEKVMTSNGAAALAMIQAGTNYVPYYPSTPATGVPEKMADYQDRGLPVIVDVTSSEDGVGGKIIGAATSGARVATATCSVALAYMFNQHLPDMVGKRLPAVINVPVRELNIGSLSIFAGESDIALFRDYGVFLRARNAQEVYYMNFIARRIADKLRVPVFVVYTGFRNSHTAEAVDIIDDYDAILEYVGEPDFSPTEGTMFDQEDPKLFGPITTPVIMHEQLTELWEDIAREAETVIPDAFSEFERLFGKRFEAFIEYQTEDAEEIIVVQGDTGETIETIVDELRERGRKVGVLQIVQMRPFPDNKLRDLLVKINPKTITVLDNSDTAFLHNDVVRALYGTDIPVWGPVIYGLGGRDFFPEEAKVLFDTLEAFSVIQLLGTEGAPVAITQELLEDLVREEAVTLGSMAASSWEDIIEGKVGARNIPAIISKLNAEGLAGNPDLLQSAIFEKLAQGRSLEIFGAKYYFGARRRGSYDKLVHALVIELGIRLSRSLLSDTEQGTPEERDKAARYLYNISQVQEDRVIAETELDRLRDLGRSMTLTKSSRRQQTESMDQIIARSASTIDDEAEFLTWLASLPRNQTVVVIAENADEYRRVEQFKDLVYLKVVNGIGVKELGLEPYQILDLSSGQATALFGYLNNEANGIGLDLVNDIINKDTAEAIWSGV